MNPWEKWLENTGLDPVFTQGCQWHPDLWFEDGNVVLLAGDTSLKIYHGVLTLHSAVLEQRLIAASNASHPPTYARMMYPALHLNKTAFDIGTMLDWMFNFYRACDVVLLIDLYSWTCTITSDSPAADGAQVSFDSVASYPRMGRAFYQKPSTTPSASAIPRTVLSNGPMTQT
ncbi:hypothetical protein OF83DRAFT_1288888 [Amylostereum chailletii]|nr:hypothetical protein OF83DRAFT_1288888 [Amylostereum chailletii]